MLSVTHAAVSTAGCVLFTGCTSPLGLALAIIGSQIPDLDTTKSIPGRILYPLANWFENRFPHRSVTHSLLATLTIAICSIPLLQGYGVKVWACLWLGHLLSCFADTCTKEGVALLYPNPVRCIYGSNPHNRLRTGSKAEYWVLAIFMCLSIWLININSSGGIMVEFNKVLGIKDGVEQIYNKSGNSNHIWVNVEGWKVSDRSPVNSRFYLVGQSFNQFVLQDKTGLYKTEENLVIKRMTAVEGESATIEELPLMFNDDDVSQLLLGVMYNRPNSAIYLSGELEIDEPDEVIVNFGLNFQSIKKFGNKIVLELCPIEEAGKMLNGQFGIGSLNTKIISPRAILN